MADLLNWFNGLPAVGGNGKGFHFRERETVENESDVDFDLWWNHLCVGVIEIKCRSKVFDSWLIDRPKLEMMFKRYQSKGIPAMLVYAHVVDGLPTHIDLADLRDLIASKDKWVKAPDEVMSTTNHGKDRREKPFEGWFLPRDLFWSVL